MKYLILFALLLNTPFVWSKIDLSSYDLKPTQIEIIRNFEASGKYSEAFLHKFAQAAHRQNLADERRRNTYIPPYTLEELESTIEWARGGAFASYEG